MFSDPVPRCLEAVYSDQSAIGEFEASLKDYLIAQGIRIPDAIEVLIHEAGEVGRPPEWTSTGTSPRRRHSRTYSLPGNPSGS